MKNSNIFFLFAFMFVSCFLIGCEDEKKANIIQDTSDIQEISATLYNKKEIKVTNIEKI
jgi:outer membrane murein-binding lipoprotein Lpp